MVDVIQFAATLGRGIRLRRAAASAVGGRTLFAGLILPSFFAPLPGFAAITLRVEQGGADVVVTGSGSANLSSLTIDDPKSNWSNYLTDVEIYAGPDAFLNGNVTLFSGITSGPLAFGTDPTVYEFPASVGSSGDLFGISSDDGTGVSQLVLPAGYLSGSSLSGVSTFPSLTLQRLGLTPGQVTTWGGGSGSDADSLRLEVAGSTPVPAPAPVFGVLATFQMARRLRQRFNA
jgi:hypothetical protein